MIGLHIILLILSSVATIICLMAFFTQIANNNEPSKLTLFLGCANFFFLIYNSIYLVLLLTVA